MRINKNSFIYKIGRGWEYHSDPSNLCSFFWTFILHSLIIIIFSILAIWFLVGTIIGSILVYHYGFTILREPTWFSLPTIILLLSIVLSIIIVIVWIIKTTINKIFNKIYKRNNLVSEYIKAKKNKLCPRIVYYRE